MRSIRRYLTVWLLLGIGLALLGSAVVIVEVARGALTREYVRALAGKAVALGSMLEVDEEGLDFEFPRAAMPEYSRTRQPEYFQIWIDGAVVARSESLRGGDLALPPRTGDAPVSWDLELPDGRRGKALAMPLQSRLDADDPEDAALTADLEPSTALVVVARTREPLERAMDRLVLGILGAFAVSSLVVVVVVALTVRRGLAPLRRLGERLGGMDAAALSQPLPMEGQAREVRPVLAKLDELFGRLHEAFRRERRMTANMAHELRTPLAEILSAAEVAQRWPDDEALRSEAIACAHEGAARMSEMVDALLRLARCEAGRERPERAALDFGSLVAALVADLAPRLEERGLALTTSSDREARVLGDAGLLRLVARNLLENAASHTAPGGSIASELARDGDALRWVLENGPVDLEPGDLDHVTEPLWTGEEARSRREHSGLGLSIARSAARVLGLELGLSVRDRRFRTELRLSPAPELPIPVTPAAGSSSRNHESSTPV